MFWWFWEAYLSRGVWIVEPANAGDADELAAIHSDAFARGWSIDEMDALLNDPAVVGCVLRREQRERPYGFVLSRIAEDEAEVLSVAVASARRGAGGGAQLFARHLAQLSERGVRRIVLEVDEDNPAALSLYARFGFVEVGRRKAYYQREDGTRGSAKVLALETP